MINVRRSNERGHAQHGWLESYHTFSFADYYDPKFTGFRDLLVINEDRVQSGQGFGRHSHKDMEIISYVLEGELAHQDSMGTGSVIRSGDVQRMSAGSGVQHSEFNHSKEHSVHFFQIWITPNKNGIDPSYEEKHFPKEERTDKLCMIVSPKGEQGALRIHQDAKIFATLLREGMEVSYEYAKSRHGWVQVAQGSIDINGTILNAGDGASISDEARVSLIAKKPTELLLFDLA